MTIFLSGECMYQHVEQKIHQICPPLTIDSQSPIYLSNSPLCVSYLFIRGQGVSTVNCVNN